MLALRFANGIFEPIWNRQFIDHVQITVAESIGIEGQQMVVPLSSFFGSESTYCC